MNVVEKSNSKKMLERLEVTSRINGIKVFLIVEVMEFLFSI
jgi:hypothetical protein